MKDKIPVTSTNIKYTIKYTIHKKSTKKVKTLIDFFIIIINELLNY